MYTKLIIDTLKILNTFDQIIVQIDQISSELRGRYMIFKARVLLLDATNLRIYRAWKDGLEVVYNYYWLDQNNQLIIGWDNSHEVKGISTSPHHKHMGKQNIRVASDEITLANILNVIKEIYKILTSGTYDERKYIENEERPGEFKKHDYITGVHEVGSAAEDVGLISGTPY